MIRPIQQRVGVWRRSLATAFWLGLLGWAPNLAAAEIAADPPVVTGGTNAALSAVVREPAPGTAVWFEWGLSRSYGSNTVPQAVEPAEEAVFGATLEGLSPGRVYHFRAVATNGTGRFTSGDRYFISPVLALKGDNPATSLVHRVYVDAGLTQTGPVAALGAGFSHSLAIKADGTVGGFGLNTFGQASPAPGLSNAMAVAGGFLHSVALGLDGTVRAWGQGAQGQTNVPPELTNAVAIGAGEYHSLAVAHDGAVFAWGKNDGGQTNVPPGLGRAVAVAGGVSHSYALLKSGTVVGWGANDAGQTNVPPDLTNAVALASGRNHGLALTAEGTVAAWGFGASGQTNVPSGLSNVVAIAAGYYHNLALRSDGTVVSWGLNNDGQTNSSVALSNVVAVAIAAGGYHSLVRSIDGAVVGWGRNDYGQRAAPASLSQLGGSYSVQGTVDTNTVGQYELVYHVTNHLGGANSLRRIVEVIPNPPPVLSIQRTGTNAATINWVPNTPGFILQYRDSVTGGVWNAAASGATNPVVLGLTNPPRFFRVVQP